MFKQHPLFDTYSTDKRLLSMQRNELMLGSMREQLLIKSSLNARLYDKRSSLATAISNLEFKSIKYRLDFARMRQLSHMRIEYSHLC